MPDPLTGFYQKVLLRIVQANDISCAVKHHLKNVGRSDELRSRHCLARFGNVLDVLLRIWKKCHQKQVTCDAF